MLCPLKGGHEIERRIQKGGAYVMANFTKRELNIVLDAIDAYERSVDREKQTEEMKEQIQEIHDFVRRKEIEIKEGNRKTVARILERRKTNPNYARSKRKEKRK